MPLNIYIAELARNGQWKTLCMLVFHCFSLQCVFDSSGKSLCRSGHLWIPIHFSLFRLKRKKHFQQGKYYLDISILKTDISLNVISVTVRASDGGGSGGGGSHKIPMKGAENVSQTLRHTGRSTCLYVITSTAPVIVTETRVLSMGSTFDPTSWSVSHFWVIIKWDTESP